MRRWQKINRIPWRIYCAGIGVFAVVGWWLWSTGEDVRDGRNDRGRNGVVLDAGWIADDAWFSTHGGDAVKTRYRDSIALRDLVVKMREGHVTDVFLALPPPDADGRITGVDAGQTETLLHECYGLRAVPQVGGPAMPLNDARWRTLFVREASRLIDRNPRFLGLQVHAPETKSGDADYLLLLDQIRAAMPPGRFLSVAMGEWDEKWFREVTKRADQLMIPLGEAGLSSKLHESTVATRVANAVAWSEGKSLIFATPASGLRSTLRGIHLGLSEGVLPDNYQGVALVLSSSDRDAWRDFAERFVKH